MSGAGHDEQGQVRPMTSKQRRPYGEGKPKCGAKRTTADALCERPAGWGTDHPGVGRCKRHGGSTPTQTVAAEKVIAERAVDTLRGKLRRFDEFDGSDIDYRAESLRLIAFWKWRASEYGRLLGEAYEAAERLKRAHEAGALVLAGVGDDEAPATQAARLDLERIFLTGGVTAFVGHRWDADRHGRLYAVDEGVRALVKLEKEALTELRAAIALAKDLKVAEAQIDLAKLVGGVIAGVILGVMAELHRRGHVSLAADDRLVLELIAGQMEAVGPSLMGPRLGSAS